MDIENDISVSTKHIKLPTYLGDLLDIDKEILLVFGRKKEDLGESLVFNNFDTSKSNLTGTPLEVNMSIDTTVVNEESRGHVDLVPIKLNQAKLFINNYHRNAKDNMQDDIIVCICDGSDKKRTLALISSISDHWFCRTLVFSQGIVSINYLQDNFKAMHEYHVKNCETKLPKVEAKVACLYQLYGYHLTDSDLEDGIENIGSILLKCSWNSFQFDIPQHGVINLVLQVVLGHENSSMFHMYQDLEFLQRCLTELSNTNVEMATLSLHPKEDHEVYRSLKDILHTSHRIKLSVSNTNLFEPVNDCTFTDKLWNVLKYCENTKTLQSCFQILFETIVDASFKTHIFEDDQTSMIVKTIHNILSGRMLVPHFLSQKQCLELLVDLVIQKIKRFCLNVIKFFNIKIANDYQDKWNNMSQSTNQNQRRSTRCCVIELTLSEEIAKAQFLFHTYILMEFLRLIEKYCMDDKIKKLVLKPAFYKYLTGPMPDTFFNIKIKRLCDLTVPLTFDIFHTLLRDKPCMWKTKLTTRSKYSTISTGFYYSKKPIFSSSVYNNEDNLNETIEEERLYALRLESYSDKW